TQTPGQSRVATWKPPAYFFVTSGHPTGSALMGTYLRDTALDSAETRCVISLDVKRSAFGLIEVKIGGGENAGF
ncbi:MAG: hypothetical protein ABSE59_00605, partial [Opitutaceae bacterium]